MSTKDRIREGLRRAVEFYGELGFEYLPVRAEDIPERPSETDTDPILEKAVLRSDKEALAGTIGQKDGLVELREYIGDCRRCKLSEKRKNIVFGEGNEDADLMFIGEGPGRDEDMQARPFVGEAGKLLTRLIEKLGMKREEVYIANIVKCRPPFNRNPEQDEIDTCKPFVEKQIGIIKPKVIVCLGRIAAQSLLGIKTPISRLRGHFYSYESIPVMPTFHPAYLLRNPKDKWLVWDDMQKVMEKLKD